MTAQDDISNIVRKHFENNKKGIEVWHLHNLAHKEGYNIKEIRNGISQLKKTGRLRMIYQDPILIEPVLVSEEEKLKLQKKNETVATTLGRTQDCIKIFIREKKQMPKPNDIIKQFWKSFGKPDISDISYDRKIRKWAEDGLLKRTDDFRYYYEQPKYSDGNLITYSRGEI